MRALIAVVIVLVILCIAASSLGLGVGESMTKRYGGVAFYPTYADSKNAMPPSMVSAAIVADTANTYDEGGYVETCDRCYNSMSCPQCPAERADDYGSAIANMSVAQGTDSNVIPGAEYMSSGGVEGLSVAGAMDVVAGAIPGRRRRQKMCAGPRDACKGQVNGGVYLGQGDGRFSLDCVNETFMGGEVGGDLVGTSTTMGDMSLLDPTTSGGEGFCGGGYKCMDLVPGGPHNDAAHIRNWNEMRPECHSAVTPGYHYISPPGMFGFRGSNMFDNVSETSDCRTYKTRTDEILYRDIMNLDVDAEPAGEEYEVMGINGYVFREEPNNILDLMNEQARIMAARSSTNRN